MRRMNILGWAAALLALTLSCSKTPDIEDPEAGLPPFPKAAHEIDRVPLTRAEETFVQRNLRPSRQPVCLETH